MPTPPLLRGAASACAPYRVAALLASSLLVTLLAASGCVGRGDGAADDDDVVDDAGVVVDGGCVGDVGCPCAADDTCARGQCVAGVCALCTAGDEGCVCGENGRCGGGLVCGDDNVCGACDPGSEGCTCVAGLCAEGLECADGRCVVAACPVGSVGCACRGDVQNACDVGGTCVDDVCRACAADQAGCPCVDDACSNGLICDRACREAITCADLVADEFCVPNQTCNEASGVDATCVPGSCDDGFVFEGGACVAGEPNCQDGLPGSILSSCTAAFRTCVEVGDTATCAGCLGEGVEVDGVCVGRLACGDTSCTEQEYCDITGSTPRCEPLPCAPGDARNANGVCQSCGFNCSGPGLTGRVWPFRSADSSCVCETLPSFFLQAGGGTQAELCDQDGDGWMRDAIVEPTLTSDAALLANARCGVASVDGVLLRDEHGLSVEVASCLEGLLVNPSPSECSARVPLPLVESLRNDTPGALPAGNTTPAFGERALKANEVNGLSKACIDGLADINDDGRSDLVEVQADPASFQNDPTSGRARLQSFSFFLETHRAYVETPSSGTPKLVIEERRRCDPGDFPIVYREEDGDYRPDDRDGYWRSCQRGADPGFDVFAPRPGMDFAQWSCPNGAAGCDSIPSAPPFRFPLTTPTPSGSAPPSDATLCELGASFPGDGIWRGMHHHSQFKCVQVSSAAGGANRPLADFTGGKLRLNACAATTCAVGDATCAESRTVVPASKAIEPVITCAQKAAVTGDIGFAAVEYRGYGLGFGDTPYPGGCVNEDHEFRDNLCPAPRNASAPNWNVLPPNALDNYGRSTCFLGPCPQGRADCDDDPFNGCEVDATLNESCGGCPDDPAAKCFPIDPQLSVQRPKNGVGQCDALGICQIASCDDGFEDCDGVVDNGCERSITTTTDCGACDEVCAPSGGAGNCTSGECVLGACDVGLGDCDDELGCEADITQITRCGDCNTVCVVANGAPKCADDGAGGFACAILECADGFDDCDGVVENGCETNLRLDDRHCGSCDNDCEDGGPASRNVDFICAGGTCSAAGCDPGFGDCDGNPNNGCEIQHRTEDALNHCRTCGDDCGAFNESAFSQCTASGCQVGACRDGFADCNGRASDACEVDLAGAVCDDTATNVGEAVAESTCGVFCGITTSETVFESTTGFGSRWFQARAIEAAGLCNDDLTHRIELIVPDGHDYDLRVYSDCGATQIAESTTTGDGNEQVILRVPDGSTQNRSFNYWVEVRFVEGASCAPYTITFHGRTSC